MSMAPTPYFAEGSFGNFRCFLGCLPSELFEQDVHASQEPERPEPLPAGLMFPVPQD